MNVALTRSTAGIQAPVPDSNHEVMARLADILAPGSGDLVAFLECYFDESGSHDGSPVLCVAGYLFEKEQCKALDLKWKDVLERFKLPYFRMSACAHNQNPPFNHLSKDECIEVEKAMISLVADHALLGVAVGVIEAEYDSWFEPRRGIRSGSAYTFCCWQILAGIQSWISRNQFQGKVAYFFEAGHESKTEANALMGRIFENPQLKSAYRYAAHAFVDKECVRPVQAADLLAWHQATQMKRWLKGDNRVRADFRALAAKPPHELFLANRKTMAGVIAFSRRFDTIMSEDGISGHFGRHWFYCPFDGDPGLVI